MRKIAFTTALLLPLVCMAQSGGMAPPGPAPSATAPGSAPGMDYEGSRAQLLDRLHLSATQAPWWRSYEDRLDAYSKLFYEEKPATAWASEAAPRQFAHLTDNLQNRLAALEDIEAAARELYAVLNPDQQAIASQSLLATVPSFASATNCVPTDGKSRSDKREAPQRGRRGGAMGGPSASGGSPNQIPGQY